jgi:hypothetical protein
MTDGEQTLAIRDESGDPIVWRAALLVGVLLAGTALTMWVIVTQTKFTRPILSNVGLIAIILSTLIGLGMTNIVEELLVTLDRVTE